MDGKQLKKKHLTKKYNMKKIEELTNDECQSFLNELFEDVDIKFEKIITEPNQDDTMGIEYSIESMDMKNCYISVSDPDLLIWLYNNDVDISVPLEQLKYEYNEMNETNSILFEYAMEIGRIIQKDAEEPKNLNWQETHDKLMTLGNPIKEKYDEIKKIQKDLINKI